MKKLTRSAAGIAALAVLLAISAALNVLYVHRAFSYYRELQRVHLDPLGVGTSARKRAAPEGAARGVKVVLYGDSRVQQWVPPQIAGATILNRGLGGQTSAQALGRLPYDVLPVDPDVVVIQVGINDLKTVPLFPERRQEIIARCEMQIRDMAQAAASSGAHVVLTTVLPVASPGLGNERKSREIQAAVERVNRYIRSLRTDGVEVLDVASVVSDGQGRLAPHFREDELHLSRDGYAALNASLEPVLRRHISNAQSLPQNPAT